MSKNERREREKRGERKGWKETAAHTMPRAEKGGVVHCWLMCHPLCVANDFLYLGRARSLC
jgi:hypothetical protein